MKIIQRIKQPASTLLALVWFCSIAGCRDFQDYRTPYKSFVTIGFNTLNKNDKFTITAISNTATGEVLRPSSSSKLTYTLPLNPNTSSVQLTIHSSATTRPEKLTIDYKREAVLISHQCGCTYKYILKKITPTFAKEYKILNTELSTFNDSNIDVQVYF